MKKILLLLTLTSILFFTSCELLLNEPIKGDVYYINVGLDYKNSGLSSDYYLNGTVNDAKELYAALGEVINKTERNKTGTLMIQEGYTVPTDITLPSNYPSRENVISRLENLTTITTEDDLTIFTYSGHGDGTAGDLVFATTKVNTGPYDTDTMDAETLLSLMAAIPGKKLIILDSCFSGMFVEDSPSSTNIILNNSIEKFFETYYSSDKYGKPDLFVLTASVNTESWEPNVPHVHGFFTNALLEALGWYHPHSDTLSSVPIEYPPAAKNGQITVDGLFAYIKKNQGIDSRYYGSEYQHPMTTGGPLDLVLFNL
ncbi:MAG: caspase family protein [Sphaerochaeta sp.]